MPNSFYHAMGSVLAALYSFSHNYAFAIALLTLAVVALTTPLTWKSTRSMLAMQALQPEIKKLQAKYKGDRERLNQEMMTLYRDNNINPMSGCLPLVPQMVVFLVLYRSIANLSHRATFKTLAAAQSACAAPPHGAAQIVKETGKNLWTCSDPQNLNVHTTLYQNLIASGGHMKVWGFDLSLGVRTAHGGAVVGCWILVALVVAAQYFQTRQVNSRNPAAAANPQTQMMQRIFPLFFGLISISIQAGVNVYFLVSALCRIAQQTLMFRHDPVLRRTVAAAKASGPVDVPSRQSRPPGQAGQGGLARLLGGGRPNPPGGQAAGGARPRSGGGPGGGGDAGGDRSAGSGTAGSGTGGSGGRERPAPRSNAFTRFLGLDSSPASGPGPGAKPSSGGGQAPPGPAAGPSSGNGNGARDARRPGSGGAGGGRPVNKNRSRSKKPRR